MKTLSLTTELPHRTSMSLLQTLILESDYEGDICCSIQEGDFSLYKGIFKELIDKNKVRIYDIIDNKFIVAKVEKFRY